MKRPLSPHLFLYKLQITSILSMAHRISGIFLIIFSILLVIWLFALAINHTMFATVNYFLQTIVGKILLLIVSMGYILHLFNGIRHIFWDMEIGHSVKSTNISGSLVIAITFIATVIIGYFLLVN